MEQRVREAMVNSPHMIPPLIKFIRSIPTADVAESVGEYNGLTSAEQLNLYRNKYYTDGNATEKGIIANAINDILPSLLKGDKA